MAKYADLAAAQADGVIHYWDFEEQSLTVTDKIGSWNGTVYVSDQSDRPAANVTGTDVIVSSQLGFALDMSATMPASPSNYQDFYITPVSLGILSGATPLTAWTVRLRFNWRGMLTFLGTTSVYPTLIALASNFWISFENDGKLYAYTNGPNYIGTVSAVSEDVFHEVVATYDGTTFIWYLDGQEVGSAAESTSLDLSNDASYLGGTVGTDDQADAVLDEVSIWNRTISATEVANLWNGGTPTALVGAASPTTFEASLDAILPITAAFHAGMDAAEAAFDETLPIQFSGSAYQDWTSFLPVKRLQEIYRLIITGAPDETTDLIIGGISSWQATSQADNRSSYVQAVIPAASAVIEAVSARQNGQLVIQKGYRLEDGTERYEEILRSEFDSFRYDRGPRKFTATVSGYLSGKPSEQSQRELSGIRSVSLTNGKHRVRCDIDLFLRPGMSVVADDATFQAGYINYYVSENDKFCEVGER